MKEIDNDTSFPVKSLFIISFNIIIMCLSQTEDKSKEASYEKR